MVFLTSQYQWWCWRRSSRPSITRPIWFVIYNTLPNRVIRLPSQFPMDPVSTNKWRERYSSKESKLKCVMTDLIEDWNGSLVWSYFLHLGSIFYCQNLEKRWYNKDKVILQIIELFLLVCLFNKWRRTGKRYFYRNRTLRNLFICNLAKLQIKLDEFWSGCIM